MADEPELLVDGDGSENELDYKIISFSSVSDIEKSIVESPFRAIYQTNNFLLPQVINVLDETKTVNLRPEYQRRARWTKKQKSLLIESFILNIPIPPIFLFEDDFARYEVMDGQQRLIAIREFLTNQFKLNSLTILAPLNGLDYANLPPRTKRTLERASLSAIVLLRESRATLKEAATQRVLELRKFVFERLNTGGKSLNPQEIRNAVYSGPFNDLLISLARDRVFTQIWGIPPYPTAVSDSDYESIERKQNNLYKTMGDCQIVLRYFALSNEEKIRGSMRSILDEGMSSRLVITPDQIAELRESFITRLYLANELFDQRPFRLVNAVDEKPSESMFDAVMVALNRLWNRNDELKRCKQQIQNAYWSALDTQDKIQTFSGRANTAKDIKDRINKMESLLRDVIDGGLQNS